MGGLDGAYNTLMPLQRRTDINRHVATAAASVLALLLAVTSRGVDWPQWRGPDRNGAWNETGILESFPAGGLKVRWRTPVGPGYSSPIIADGRVYLTDAELTAPTARERVHCFAETTGKPLWTYSYNVDYPEYAFSPPPGMGPTATPIAHGGKVYSLGSLGQLLCLDARSGEVLWKKSLNREYGAREFNLNSSPLIEGGVLILFIGAKPGACVVALDKDSGKEVWKALDESSTNSTPAIIDAGGKRQFIVWTQESVTSLNPRTGAVYWRVSLQTSRDQAVSTPVACGNLLLIAGLMLKLDANAAGASILWPQTKAATQRILSNTSTALFRGDYVYSARSTGQFVCLEAATGRQMWETDKVTVLKGGASVHPVTNGDSVLLYTDQGELIRARLTGERYNQISRTRLLEPTYPYSGRKVAWPPPAYANRHVFARNDKELICASLAARP